MALSRRRFLQFSAGTAAALGVNIFENPLLSKAFAEAVKSTPIIWLATGACTGCTVSLLNSRSPRIQDILLDQVIPGHHTELAFHSTVMAAAGDQAMEAMYAAEERSFLLVVEGSIMTLDPRMCEIGEVDHHGITSTEHMDRLGPKAQAVIAVGSCAAFGGVNKANMNPTGSVGVADYFKQKGITTPVINIPGCAIHPDWFVGTLAAYLLAGPESIELDEHLRPKMFFSKLIHDNCPLRGHFDAGRFAQHWGDPYCLYKLGCKGPVAHANCPEKKFNAGVNYCLDNRHPCIGCVEPEFPYEGSMFEPPPVYNVTPPAAFPPIVTEQRQNVDFSPTYGALAGIAVGAAGASMIRKRSAEAKQDLDEKE